MLVSLGSYGEQLNNLFGITLYENAEKYVSSNYINSNKYKNLEKLRGVPLAICLTTQLIKDQYYIYP